jgi:hypothetical protein
MWKGIRSELRNFQNKCRGDDVDMLKRREFLAGVVGSSALTLHLLRPINLNLKGG